MTHLFATPRSALLATLLLPLSLACSGHDEHAEGHEEAHHPIVLTRPSVRDVPTHESFVAQVHSRRHIEVRALEGGYLLEIPVQEGQAVREGEVLFRITPVMFRARLDAHRAELHLADIKVENTQRLFDANVVSDQELAVAMAERERARAEVDLARAEYRFANIVAPFDGIIDRQLVQQGSLVEEGDMLTTISDNSVMWVYFNVPEADYLDFKAIPDATDPEAPQLLHLRGSTIQLRLANGQIFDQEAGDTVTIESDFDNATGNIRFRADFPNPNHLLRHGQTGTLLINETLHDALVIPQRATFEILDRQFVYVVSDDMVVHQREIHVSHELDDIYVIESGLEAGETFVFEGARQVHDGERIENHREVDADEVLQDLSRHAE